MSLSTEHHAKKKAKEMSEDELRSEIERLKEAKKNHPTYEFDDKRVIHKMQTRKRVYEEELESR